MSEAASMQGKRVLVAMSGGVDSSLAAALLHEQGADVFGVTLHLWDAEGESKVGRCCAPEDRDDARRTCELLGVPHYVIDERTAFRTHVVDPFVRDNLRGQTPSPCVQCNQHVKLGRLLELADGLGASHVATGHYARLGRTNEGRAALLRARDRDKDQSYFLFGLEPALLERLLFPLSELIKDAARQEARRLGVPSWNKPDSQELCFVPDGNVAGFVEREQGEASIEGAIVDEAGKPLGSHPGIAGITVGQRRGLRIPGKEPRYVLRVVADRNEVVIGSAEQLEARELRAIDARFSEPLTAPLRARVRIRYRHEPAEALVSPTAGGGFSARFDQPQRAIAPGQAAVIYAGERVLGGGFIVA
jgi:tRNA-specific 2-thiouridylase